MKHFKAHKLRKVTIQMQTALFYLNFIIARCESDHKNFFSCEESSSEYRAQISFVCLNKRDHVKANDFRGKCKIYS